MFPNGLAGLGCPHIQLNIEMSTALQSSCTNICCHLPCITGPVLHLYPCLEIFFNFCHSYERVVSVWFLVFHLPTEQPNLSISHFWANLLRNLGSSDHFHGKMSFKNCRHSLCVLDINPLWIISVYSEYLHLIYALPFHLFMSFTEQKS